jgi:hypothetical protein
MPTATWFFEEQPEGGFLMWLEEDPQRPLPAHNLAQLKQQCNGNSISDESFDDICRQLTKDHKATIRVPLPGRFSIGRP